MNLKTGFVRREMMIKSISFLPQFIPLIKNGIKTVTRRIKFTGNPGDIYYFEAGRLGKKEGYVIIKSITVEGLRDLRDPEYYSEKKLINEVYSEGVGRGYRYPYSTAIEQFRHLWDQVNNKSGVRWEDNPLVKRVTFKYLEKGL